MTLTVEDYEKMFVWCKTIWAEIDCGPREVSILLLGPNQTKHYTVYGKTMEDAICKGMTEEWDRWDQEQRACGLNGPYDEKEIFMETVTDDDLEMFRYKAQAAGWDSLVKRFDESDRHRKVQTAWDFRYQFE